MRKITALALSAMLSVPILAQGGKPGNSPDRSGESTDDDLFTYVITTPAEGEETFREVTIQFPGAAEIAFIPSFMERPGYLSFKKNGQPYATGDFNFPSYEGNTLTYGLDGATASTEDRWELTIQPGLFKLLDANENSLGENPLMEIVVTEGLPVANVDFSFTTDPADPDGKLLLTELQTVTLTFGALETVTADADAAVVTLGGTTLDKSLYAVSSTGSDNTVAITFDPAMTTTEDATLTVTFPEGSLTGKQGNVSDTNKTPVNAAYKLVPAAAHDLTIDFHQPKPDADGNLNVNQSLAMAMFICDMPDIKIKGGQKPVITLKEVNGDFESSGELQTLTGMVSGKSTFYAAFNQPVYNGEYTITLPEGSIGDTRWRADHSMGHTNGEVVLRFNITGGEDRPVSNLFEYEITSPAEGAETFRYVNIRFPKAVSASYLPSFLQRPEYFEFRINGKKYLTEIYPSFGDSDNEISFDLSADASTDDRWELTIQPGLFELLDANENSLGENPLMEIVVTEGAPVSNVDFTFSSEPANTDPNEDSMMLTEVSEIKLTFPNLDTITADGDAAALTLGATALEKSAYTVTADGTGNVMTVAFEPALTSTEDATLTLTFPAGSLTGKKGDVSDTNKTNVESRYYTVVPAAAHDLTIDFQQPKPDADGNLNVNQSLAMAMFVCDMPDIKIKGGQKPVITLKEVNGDFESSGELQTLTGMVSGKSTFYAAFNQPVYNGEYTITLPEGSIGDTRWRADHSMGHTNGEVVLRFNIIGGEDRPVGPHIDLSTTFVSTEALAVKGVPSEDDIYWWANIIETSRYPGDAEMLESAINFFKLGAETFGMDWVTVFQMTAKKGEYTWGFSDLVSQTDYTVYAFGLDSNGDLYMPLTKIEVRTADPIVSDNTFTAEVISVENGTEPETKKVTVKATPTNDDPYAVVILEKYNTDQYDLSDEASHKNYLRNVLRPLVTSDRVYTGEQTVVFDNVKIDAIMQAAVFGYEGYETTKATIVDFSTVDDDFVAMTVEAYDPTISGASATLYSFDMVRPFVMGVISKESADLYGGIENIHENYRKPLWEADGMGYYDWRYFARQDLKRQPLDGTLKEIAGVSSLKWETDYYVYGYLMDEGGYRTSPVYYDEFTTASRNVTDTSFELKLNSMTSNAPVSPDTYTADLTIVPSDNTAQYAIYYGDTYDFEEYLDDNRVDDWMYDVFMQRRIKRNYTDELNFGFGGVYSDKTYILVVCGFDEAPNTEPTWMLFNKDGIVKDSWSGISTVTGDSLRIYTLGHDIHVEGEFSDAAVYTADGLNAGTFKGNVCRVDGSGCYIVRVQTSKGIETRKIAVK